MNTRFQRTLTGLALLCLTATVPAQTPAAAGKTATLGNARAGAKLLTREELRTCLKQKTDLAARKPPLEAERASLDRERAELQQIDDSLKSDRAAMDRMAESAASITKRSKELSAQVADFNERVASFQNSGRSGPTADRQQREFEREKKTLDSSAAALDSERAALGPNAEQSVKAYNARLATREQAATDWNARNGKLAKSAQDLDIELENWKADCEGRPYREDDEKAIQAGK
jgi:hypothetical protein